MTDLDSAPASAARNHAWRAQLDPAAAPHGTTSGYSNWGCRCPLCTAAQRTKMRAYKDRQKAVELQPISLPADLTPAEVARFRTRIPVGSGCQEWSGERDQDGYGRFTVYRQGREIRLRACRLALALKLAREPIGETRHTCDNPPCCRADHLLEGSHSENMLDAARRGRLHRPREGTP